MKKEQKKLLIEEIQTIIQQEIQGEGDAGDLIEKMCKLNFLIGTKRNENKFLIELSSIEIPHFIDYFNVKSIDKERIYFVPQGCCYNKIARGIMIRIAEALIEFLK